MALSGPVPLDLFRNLKHPANPGNLPFDDLEIEFLASVFTKFRPLFKLKPVDVASCLTDCVQALHIDLAYSFDHGARVAVVGQGKCNECGSIYNLQTFTSGLQIQQEIGKFYTYSSF